MTIAACYLSAEGVILGADSTSTSTLTIAGEKSIQHLEYAQKIFEIGEKGTLAIVCWGMGSVGSTSFRTMAAELGDELTGNPNYTVQGAVDWWRDKFWSLYEVAEATQISRAIQLMPRIAELSAKSIAGTLTETEKDEVKAVEKEINELNAHGGGFCLGGRDAKDRTPHAFQVVYDPFKERTNSVTSLPIGWAFWGCPDIVQRIIYGIDRTAKEKILASGKWTGTPADLDAALTPINLQPYTILPLREAVDWIHSMLYATLKAYKFSMLPSLCGGPIDIALVSSDRPFRWIRHKSLGAAIIRSDHNLGEVLDGYLRG